MSQTLTVTYSYSKPIECHVNILQSLTALSDEYSRKFNDSLKLIKWDTSNPKALQVTLQGENVIEFTKNLKLVFDYYLHKSKPSLWGRLIRIFRGKR